MSDLPSDGHAAIDWAADYRERCHGRPGPQAHIRIDRTRDLRRREAAEL